VSAPPAPPLLLASRSPQRRAILEQLVIPFEAVIPQYEEKPTGTDPVAEVRDKAQKAADRVTAHVAAAKGTTDESATIEELKRRVQTLEQEAEKARREAAALAKRE